MTTLLENPAPIFAVGGVAAVMALVYFLARRTLGGLAALVAVLAVTAGLVVVERLVVTEREEIEIAVTSILAAIKANDLPAIQTSIDPAEKQILADAETLSKMIQVKGAGANGGLGVVVDESASPRTATSKFRAILSGTLRNGGAPIAYFDDVEVRWIKRDGRWLVSGYTAYHEGQPIDAVGSARGARPVPK